MNTLSAPSLFARQENVLLNTGALLQRPYESPYAAFRRFVISNADYPYAEITRYLRKAARNNHPTANTASLVQLTQWYAESRQSDRQHGDDNASPETTNPCTRNCQYCAEMGYHSAVYEMPWLLRCPLHDQPLRETCLRCGERWPTIANIFTRKCTACGRHISMKVLLDAGALSNIADFEKLRPLYECAAFSEEFSPYALVQNMDSSRVLYHHPALSAKSVILPNAYYRLGRSTNETVKSGAVVRSPICVFTYPLSRGSTVAQDLPLSPSTLKTCRKRVTQQIIAAIACTLGGHHRPSLATFGYSASSYTRCPYCIALTVWLNFIAGEATANRFPREQPEIELYDNPTICYMPHLPAPMQSMEIKHENSTRYLALPSSLRELIYAVDLWTTYINILHHVVYYFARPEKTNWQYFTYNLPRAAHPNRSLCMDIGIRITNDATIQAVIPSAVVSRNTLPAFELSDRYARATRTRMHFCQRGICC